VQGMRATESMFVANVVGPSQTRTPAPDTDERTRGFVELLKATLWLTQRRLFLMMSTSLMKITNSLVRTPAFIWI